MEEAEVIYQINMLYEKYSVGREFIENMEGSEIIRGMKGILAELDQNKKRSYDEQDMKLIKDIYGKYC